MWTVTANDGGDFEGKSLKAVAASMGEFYAQDDRSVRHIESVSHCDTGREFPKAKFPRLINALDAVVEAAHAQELEDIADGIEYKRQVNSYYNSTRGCK